MRAIKTALNKIGHAARFSVIPSLSASALLILGTVAATQYQDFSNYLVTHWKYSYFLEPQVVRSTALWGIKVMIFGFLFSVLFLINSRAQEEALEKLRKIDNT